MEAKIDQTVVAKDQRKIYERPEIVHELELETRAGSPYPTPFVIDPLDDSNP